MDNGREHLFSAKFACPICSYSIPELEPRLFSFNNPLGACPRCDGLGEVTFFDPKRVVAFPHLSLAGGAIRGWDRRNQFYFSMLASLAQHYGFDVEAPFESLPQRAQDVVLHGSGEEKIAFRYPGEKGRSAVKEHVFEGIVPNLERRYRETDSVAVKEELAKYLNTRACPECGMTFTEFKQKGRFGCSRDYDEFLSRLVPLLQRIHGAAEHTEGAAPEPEPPKRRSKAGSVQSELRKLRRELQRVVEHEEYEEAARIRDRIKSLEQILSGGEAPG